MANRAKRANWKNHIRQQWYKTRGFVMIPTLSKERKLRGLAKKIHDKIDEKKGNKEIMDKVSDLGNVYAISPETIKEAQAHNEIAKARPNEG